MTNVHSIPSPSILSEDRAHEADHPTSLVVKFGPDQPLKLDCGVDLAPFQIAYQTYGTLNRERDDNRCQYTGRLLAPEEGSLDHILPRSRGGADTWENLVWSSKDVNTRKGNRLPHEAGLKLLRAPRAPKELPASALIRNAHGVAEWKLFLNG